jgi:hypothetical protein
MRGAISTLWPQGRQRRHVQPPFLCDLAIATALASRLPAARTMLLRPRACHRQAARPVCTALWSHSAPSPSEVLGALCPDENCAALRLLHLERSSPARGRIVTASVARQQQLQPRGVRSSSISLLAALRAGGGHARQTPCARGVVAPRSIGARPETMKGDARGASRAAAG